MGKKWVMLDPILLIAHLAASCYENIYELFLRISPSRPALSRTSQPRNSKRREGIVNMAGGGHGGFGKPRPVDLQLPVRWLTTLLDSI